MKSKRYYCHICPKSYASNSLLKHHVARHLGTTKEHKCDQCEYVSDSKWIVTNHKNRVHNNKSRLLCLFCGVYKSNSHPRLDKHVEKCRVGFTRVKTKENVVHSWVKGLPGMTRNFYINTQKKTNYKGSRIFIDFVFRWDNLVYCIEVDEHQHHRYCPNKERERMKCANEYFKSKGWIVVWIRFNPDKCRKADNVYYSTKEKRKILLEQLITKTDKDEIRYLFYNDKKLKITSL